MPVPWAIQNEAIARVLCQNNAMNGLRIHIELR